MLLGDLFPAGHPHEGSSYPSQKNLQTAWHRLEHARSSVNELERIRSQISPAQKPANLVQQQQHQQHQQPKQQQQTGATGESQQ